MQILTLIKRNTYRDSIALMQVASRLTEMPGVEEAAAIMGTQVNKELVADAGLLTEEAKAAGANDLVIVIQAEDEESLERASREVEVVLDQEEEESVAEKQPLSSLMEALKELPDANLVLISTPGPYAATEAYRALMAGQHVFMFSDNVALEDEIWLKEIAIDRELLMMGPDSGTAIINGYPLGFANIVRRGSIGIVSASGTGLQEVSSLIHHLGSGISQGIGVGSRDLSERVKGRMMHLALEALAEDLETRVIVLISKPPSPTVAKSLLEKAQTVEKPVVINFLGEELSRIKKYGLTPASTLEDAAIHAVTLLEQKDLEPRFLDLSAEAANRLIIEQSDKLSNKQRWVRGLFSGGTFCLEAQLVCRDFLGKIYSNDPLQPQFRIGVDESYRQHSFIDYGADEFTQGRPHPMIDFRIRKEAIYQAATDPEVAVILFDIVLGYGAHSDPAGEVIPVINEVRKGRSALAFIASVCGTDDDPQNRSDQESRLRTAGAVVMPSNAQAARMAAFVATRKLL